LSVPLPADAYWYLAGFALHDLQELVEVLRRETTD
jgi:hypothetical protein